MTVLRGEERKSEGMFNYVRLQERVPRDHPLRAIRALVDGCRARGCVPHVAQNDANRRSAIDARSARHPGYAIGMTKRKRIEEPFGRVKTAGVMRKTRLRGRPLVEWFFVLTAAVYNLIRIPKPLAAG